MNGRGSTGEGSSREASRISLNLVEGGMDQSPRFVDQNRKAADLFSAEFKQADAGGSGDFSPSKVDSDERSRAKVANRIYRKACDEAGVKQQCFFKNFGLWSDFVKGRISESEFSDRTRSVAEQMASQTEQ
ncbi:MAG: hypothetical protein ACLGPL_09820 [Acidobacteriota bacterium]